MAKCQRWNRIGWGHLLVIDTDSEEAVTEASNMGLPPTLIRRSRWPAWLYLRLSDCPAYRAVQRGQTKRIDLLSSGLLIVYGQHQTGCRVYIDGEVDSSPSPAPEWATELITEAARKRDYGPVDLPGDIPTIDLEILELPEKLRSIILYGRPDRSKAVYYVSTELMRLGFPDETIAAILWDQRFAISEKIREQGLNWLAGDIARARPAAYCGDLNDRGLVEGVCQWMELQDWSGMAGATDWHVLLAHLNIIRRTGKTEYNAAVLSLAEQIGIDKDIVVDSDRRLQQRGVLVPVEVPRRATEPHTWTLQVPTGFDNKPADQELCIPSVMYLHEQVSFHDAWTRQGLGMPALRLWAILLSKPRWQINDLVERLGVGQRQVRRTLKTLAEQRLAENVDEGSWRGCGAGQRRLDEITQALNVLGVRERQRETHRVQRAEYLAFLRRPRPRRKLTSGKWVQRRPGVRSDTDSRGRQEVRILRTVPVGDVKKSSATEPRSMLASTQVNRRE